LKTLSLEQQFIQINADRYCISGSCAVITDKTMIKQSEIRGTPFHRYLVSTVLKMNPKSITVKSCSSDGSCDLDVALRSMKKLLEFLSENQIKGVSK
jgi:hypothetical protein